MALVTIILQDQPMEGDPDKTKLAVSYFANPAWTEEGINESPALVAGLTAYIAIQKIIGNATDD